jgi:hypothetical protein
LVCPTPGCGNALATAEDAEPVYICCDKCQKMAPPEYVRQGQEMMLSLPAKYDFTTNPEEVR